MSCSVAKDALPITRFSSMRPATQAVGFSASRLPLSSLPWPCVQIAREVASAEIVRERRARFAQARELLRGARR
jgi:hypothetical protein